MKHVQQASPWLLEKAEGELLSRVKYLKKMENKISSAKFQISGILIKWNDVFL